MQESKFIWEAVWDNTHLINPAMLRIGDMIYNPFSVITLGLYLLALVSFVRPTGKLRLGKRWHAVIPMALGMLIQTGTNHWAMAKLRETDTKLYLHLASQTYDEKKYLEELKTLDMKAFESLMAKRNEIAAQELKARAKLAEETEKRQEMRRKGKYEMATASIGCKWALDEQELERLSAQEDYEAYGKRVYEAQRIGECIRFKIGELVYLSDVKMFSALVQIRRSGDTQEYWVPVDSIKR